MEAKEKAKELYFKMLRWEDESSMYIERDVISSTSKQCALIAVDEIIKSHNNLYGVNNKQVKFYLAVKTEIEKL